MMRSSNLISAIVLLVLLGTTYGRETRLFKCPCVFSVSREVAPKADKEAFDVLVEPFASLDRTLKSKESNIIEEHSSRNIRISDAIETVSGYHSFKKMSIREKGLFRVRIRHHTTRTGEADPEYNLELHTSARQVVCPVVLQPDPPLLTPAARTLNDENSIEDTIRQGRSRDPRIVGGLFISPTLRPYLAAIQIPVPCEDGSTGCFNLCTGTILSPRWLMTAAHCGVTEGSSVLVNSQSNRFGLSTTVSRAIPHPDYDEDMGALANFYDIALLETADDMRTCCGGNPRFMPVSRSIKFPRSGTFVRAAGYGVTSENGTVPEPVPGLLRQVDVPVVSFEACLITYEIISEIEQVCAGYFRDGECDSCFGDSGGPLVQYAVDGTPILIGVTSFGSGCARREAPGVYTKPSGHLEWLQSTDADFTVFRGRYSHVRRRCRRGEFLPFIEGGVSRCTACREDQFSGGGATRECQQCPGELLRDTRSGNRCSCRRVAGSGIVRGEERCSPCRPGFASRVGAAKCLRCRAGTYAPESGLAACLPCPGARRGATECETAEASPEP